MNLYYAVGGGLGHFSRAIAFIHTHPGLSVRNTVVMVADRDMYSLAVHHFLDKRWADLKVVKIPTRLFQDQNGLRHWLSEWLDQSQPEVAYLDTFHAGISGEWNGLAGKAGRICYIGRYLNWEAYPHQADIIFDHAYQLEYWHSGQCNWLRQSSQSVTAFSLRYPKASVTEALQQKIREWQQNRGEVWAVIHSEPKGETEALLNYARDQAALEDKNPLYLLCSSQASEAAPDVHLLRLFPAYGLFPWVDRIVTACGFNLMQQSSGFRRKHLCMPFPRRYDDQFLRFKQWKAAGKK